MTRNHWREPRRTLKYTVCCLSKLQYSHLNERQCSRTAQPSAEFQCRDGLPHFGPRCCYICTVWEGKLCLRVLELAAAVLNAANFAWQIILWHLVMKCKCLFLIRQSTLCSCLWCQSTVYDEPLGIIKKLFPNVGIYYTTAYVYCESTNVKVFMSKKP